MCIYRANSFTSNRMAGRAPAIRNIELARRQPSGRLGVLKTFAECQAEWYDRAHPGGGWPSQAETSSTENPHG